MGYALWGNASWVLLNWLIDRGMCILLQYLDIPQWVAALGYFGLFFIIFIETGLFFGFFLPGDSLVVTAGFLASQGVLNIWILVPLFVITAILGYALAYWFGKALGSWMLQRKDGWLFKRRYLEEARIFYDKHGPLALVVGRLIPIIRTFVPIAAGLAGMPYRRYMFWNIVGAILWGGVLCLFGYVMGILIPNAKHYILPCVVAIVGLSLIPAIWHIFRKK